MANNNGRYTTKQMIDAIKLKETGGFVSKVAEYLGCTPQTVYNYRDKHPTVAAALVEIKEKRHDFVESKMMQRIGEGSDTMIIFYAKTQMKDRGYIERQQIDLRTGDLKNMTDDELLAIVKD